MAAKTHEIAFKIVGNLGKRFTGAFAKAAKAMGSLNDEINETNKKAAQIGHIRQLRKEVGLAKIAYNDATSKVEALKPALESSYRTLNKLKTVQEEARLGIIKYGTEASKLDSKVSKNRTELQRLEKELVDLKEGMKTAKQPTLDQLVAIKKLTKQIYNLRYRTKQASKSAEEARVSQNNYKNILLNTSTAIKSTEERLSKQRAEFDKARVAADKATTALKKQRQSLQNIEKQYGTTDKKLSELIKKQNELTKSANRAAAAQRMLSRATELKDQASSKMSSAAMTAGVVGAATVGSVVFPIKEAMKMEDAMADIRKVTDLNEAELGGLQNKLEKMSLSIPLAADGLAEIAASAAQSGINAKSLDTFTEQAAKMATAFDITAADAGEMMAKWKSGMGLTENQTYKLADAVNYLSNNDAARAAQIGDVIKRYGALGRVSGLAAEQTAALATSVIAAGAEPEAAATAIKALMREMGQGGSMNPVQKAAFKHAKLDPIKLQRDIQENAPEAIIGALTSIRDNVEKHRQNQYLSVMFGDEAARAVGPMLSNLEGLKKNFSLVAKESNYAGSMQKEYLNRLSTASNSVELFKNAISYVSRAIGQPLLGPLKTIVKMLIPIATVIGNFIKTFPILTSIIVIGGLAIGTLITVLFALSAAFWAVNWSIQQYRITCVTLWKIKRFLINSEILHKIALIASAVATKLFTGAMLVWKAVCIVVTAAQWAWNAALTANPIGIVIVLIGALVAAGVALWKNWDKMKEKCKELWQSIRSFFNNISGMWEGIVNIWNNITGFFGGGKKKVEIESKVNAAVSNVPKMAKGGIATKPTLAMIGEGRESEAVLPLSKLKSMLGGTRGENEIHISFAPVININGNATLSDIERGLLAGQNNLKKELDKLFKNNRRLSYS